MAESWLTVPRTVKSTTAVGSARPPAQARRNWRLATWIVMVSHPRSVTVLRPRALLKPPSGPGSVLGRRSQQVGADQQLIVLPQQLGHALLFVARIACP